MKLGDLSQNLSTLISEGYLHLQRSNNIKVKAHSEYLLEFD